MAGYLKLEHGWKTGYTRKLYHFTIFGSAAFCQHFWGVPGVFIIGSAATIAIFHGVLKGDGSLFYEPLAREKDAPRRSYFIIAPYLATLIGGFATNMYFGETALLGYLVAGIADAVAEPIGVRFGTHHYKVPSLVGIPSNRSFEGSAAVFIATIGCFLLGTLLLPNLPLTTTFWVWLVPFALVCTLVEAFSPHGWDNLTLQLTPPFLIVNFLST